MKVKHQSLKDELDGVLKNNVERLKRHQESHMDVIDEKLNDAAQHVSFLEKNLNEAAKCQPAQALILLQSSSSSSLEKDLFKTYKVNKPRFVENKTGFIPISDIFGKLYSNEVSGSIFDEEELQTPRELFSGRTSADSAIDLDDNITLEDELKTTLPTTSKGLPRYRDYLAPHLTPSILFDYKD